MITQLNISKLSITKSNSFTELNPLGLYIYNSPSNYIKFGSGSSEIKTDNLKVDNLAVYGNLLVFGEQIISSSNVDVSGTISNIFTIGSTTGIGSSSLQFGQYTTNTTLTANGASITSSVPLNVPGLHINGSPALTSVPLYKYLYTVGVNGIFFGVHIALPAGKTYIVGNGNLLIFLDGRLQIVNEDYNEVGSVGAPSAEIKFNFHLAEHAKILFLIIG